MISKGRKKEDLISREEKDQRLLKEQKTKRKHFICIFRGGITKNNIGIKKPSVVETRVLQ